MKIVIFGGSGDLSKRKIFPSLAKLDLDTTKIIVYSRSDLAQKFRVMLEEFYTYEESFYSKIEFVRGNYEEIALDSSEEYIFYFSVPPKVYGNILKGLDKFKGGFIAVEKPFGCDSKTFDDIVKFKESHDGFRIMLIDHYLLKPLCVFFPLIKKNIVLDESVMQIDFISKEELGVEGRLYFDATGIVKDIVQNHLLELYCSLLCNSHEGMSNKAIGERRIEILKHTSILADNSFGQYEGYEDEIGQESHTETFAQVFLKNDLPEFKDATFSFIAGKGMDEKKTEIRVQYKKDHFKSVIERTLKTSKIRDMDNLSLSQLTVSSTEDNLVKKSHINNVTLVLNLAPSNKVYFIVEVNNKIHEFVLFDKETITGYFETVYGKLDDHAVIFDGLLNNKEVPLTLLEEGYHQWRIFGNVKTEPKFYYEKGVSEPEDIIKDD